MKRILSIVMVSLMIPGLLMGCKALDVVLRQSRASFVDILEAHPGLIGLSQDGRFTTLTVDGSTFFYISLDFSGTNDGDLKMVTPLKPFLDAGLDVTRLDPVFHTDDQLLTLASEISSVSGSGDSFADALYHAASVDRSLLSYHEELDHFGMDVATGKLEWAKTYRSNDKDIVFLLPAAPFSEAGADVRKVDGWTLVEMSGKDGEAMKLLVKPYNLVDPIG